ncbi:gamma-glutamyltransferase family protein [Billgrantia bachuensis]|uniref:Gamma-glutamyltransferase family protein n=1 Tax=Billgrantia bachuensis TaxID=2717286 RepID=A0ABX0PPL0_9GAMM|nr:gamma-glutamyltransferase family protein [Halomonas bachuensis]NIC05058.1 gamma-glutamyltransferase family protein [Halomonas bachuensis]
MQHDAHYYPSPSRRMATYGNRGMVATSQSLGAQAGMQILQQGGNAVDAAIATAAALTVVEPTSNGLGSDAFAIVWIDGKLHGLNASGPAPRAATIEAVKALGHERMPEQGVLPVTVPGAPAAWAALSERFGKLAFADLLAPAIALAEQGFPVSPTVSRMWEDAFEAYRGSNDSALRPWFDVFAPDGRAPRAGERWAAPDHAYSLRAIAATHGKAFYRGELAERIDTFFRKHGGLLRREDLAAFEPEWVEPIGTRYRGHDIWEIPPNGSGLIALQALGMLERLGEEGRDPVETLHRRIEATKLGYVDGLRYVTERDAMGPSVEQLLADDYLQVRANLIGQQALEPKHGNPIRGGTVYLATADGDGNMVSFIQSNYMGFGSGVVVPGTGISLQNRGCSFSLDPGHANALAPGKRTYHTIIPGFITRNGAAVGPFGVMGGFMQPQGHVQVVSAMLDDRLNPQAALDLPRWKWTRDRTVEVEPHFPDHLAQALARRGHRIVKRADSLSFGRSQVILRDSDSGVLCGGTEPRTDGAVLAW